MIKVGWIVDVPGWAYANRAENISRALPKENYEHRIVVNIVKNFSEALQQLHDVDIIVCPDPRIIRNFVPWPEKIVLNVNAIKIFM